MKKLLLASAIAAISLSTAQAAPTIYGKAFLTLDLNSGDTDTTVTNYDANGNVVGSPFKDSKDSDDRSQLNSIGSRVGLKGSEPLLANTDLVYQLEYGIDVDAGSAWVDANNKTDHEKSDQFYARDTYIGLKHDQYGMLVGGRLTAIDDYINYANVAQGGVLGGDDVLASFNGPRANNSFAYFSPSYNDMQFMAMYVMDENNETDTLDRDAFGIGGKYELDNMNVGATYIQAGDLKFARVSGNYALNPMMTVGALYQNGDYDTDDNENAFTISGEMKTATPWTVYAQGDFVNNVEGASDADTYRALVGGKYAFNKATTGHLYGAFMNAENESGSKALGTVTTEESDGFGLGAGIEYKF